MIDSSWSSHFLQSIYSWRLIVDHAYILVLQVSRNYITCMTTS
ncbi:putative mannan synthase 11 isoform X1 [Iris pallida]|uniref:Mannan synthase 11 isoform X1 n=1 Tax=Iris pallida TaxID=29817 RepID=A0AAX6FQJ2_IRIPA|nr:putative mannan synthase 11 isoform X1 [Iris pallida]